MKNLHQCISCKYFIQHYSINKGYAIPTYCGRCTKEENDIKALSRKKCDYFAPIIEEIEQKEKEQTTLNILKQIKKSIKNLELYLQKNSLSSLSNNIIQKSK